MTSLRWVADGIEVAEACGGVTLDKRQRVGFARGTTTQQRPREGGAYSGYEIQPDPEPWEYEEDGKKR